MKDFKQEVKLIAYRRAHREDFKQLNYHWLRRYFEVTPLDEKFFNNPEEEIIDKGGYVFLAESDNQVVGCFALEKENATRFKLAKMAVTPSYQGRQIGSFLLEKAIEKARALNIKTLVLHTHHTLIKAMNLYVKHGFKFARVDEVDFARATIKMGKTLRSI